MNLSVFLLVSLSSIILGQDTISYDEYSLFRVTPKSQEQLQLLSTFIRQNKDALDVWVRSDAINHAADIVVPPTLIDEFRDYLYAGGLDLQVMIQDIGKLIEDQSGPADCSVESPHDFFCNYNSYNKIIQFMEDLVAGNPDYISMQNLGTSYEGRPLYALRISANNKKKPVIWLQSGQHAREQIGPAVATYIAQEITSLLGTDDDCLIGDFDWYILPVLNPDGYEYAQSVDRLWRKTRSQHDKDSDCFGVDPNRNWDIKWNDRTGSSLDPCNDYYAGPAPFSEPETKAISQYMINSLTGPLKLFIDFHSYSQKWLSPYGYTRALPRNYAAQNRLGRIAASALKEVHGSDYTVGSTGNLLYTVTGGARDWVYDVLNATFSYVVELRDKGRNGFLLSRRQILPNCEEMWAGIKAMGLELAKSEV